MKCSKLPQKLHAGRTVAIDRGPRSIAGWLAVMFTVSALTIDCVSCSMSDAKSLFLIETAVNGVIALIDVELVDGVAGTKVDVNVIPCSAYVAALWISLRRCGSSGKWSGFFSCNHCE